MTAVSRENYANRSITYNGVQFGGADSDFPSLPPEYSWTSTPVYDDAGRTVKFSVVTFNISCEFFAASESAMRSMMSQIRQRLEEPGKLLTIVGLGTGFGLTSNGQVLNDVDWGPRPGPAKWTPKGDQQALLEWSIEFSVKSCVSGSGNDASKFRFLALNFDQTWQHDLEGVTTRTISGYAEVPQTRNPLQPKAAPRFTADEVRDHLTILLPAGYRRQTNVWKENAAKNRIDFVIVDEQLPGEAPPPGVISAEGSFEFSTQGIGFNKGLASLSMAMKTAPGVPPKLAGQLFITTALTKQFNMQREIGNSGTVIPVSFRLINHKYDRSRITEGAISWTLTKCFNAMLKASGIWEPFTPNNYTAWEGSVRNLWVNRGVDGAESLPKGDLIIDACDNAQNATIGYVANKARPGGDYNLDTLKCPDIPPDGGWLKYELTTHVYRKDDVTTHKKAVKYLPGGGSSSSPGSLPGPSFSKTGSDEDVVEYHGLPKTLILLVFKAMRFKHQITFPELKMAGGKKPIFRENSNPQLEAVFDLFDCPVWAMQGWALYEVNGHVSSMQPHGSMDVCSQFATGRSSYYNGVSIK